MRQTNTPAYTADDELDLGREWDAATCGTGRDELRAYLQRERPHLLTAYDADFLVNAAERTRVERLQGNR